jgi:hypothetical protein
MRRLLNTEAPAATILVRILAATIFLSEASQKFFIRRKLADRWITNPARSDWAAHRY